MHLNYPSAEYLRTGFLFQYSTISVTFSHHEKEKWGKQDRLLQHRKRSISHGGGGCSDLSPGTAGAAAAKAQGVDIRH